MTLLASQKNRLLGLFKPVWWLDIFTSESSTACGQRSSKLPGPFHLKMAILFPEREQMGKSLWEYGGGVGGADPCSQTRLRPSGPFSGCTLWTAPSGQRHSCLSWCVSSSRPLQPLGAPGFPCDLEGFASTAEMCLITVHPSVPRSP